jgi:DnaJ-class molecular chaperone
VHAGVDEESVLRLRAQGDAGVRGGAAGDLYIMFAVRPSSGLERRGLDLYSQARSPGAPRILFYEQNKTYMEKELMKK